VSGEGAAANGHPGRAWGVEVCGDVGVRVVVRQTCVSRSRRWVPSALVKSRWTLAPHHFDFDYLGGTPRSSPQTSPRQQSRS
jgi:hypothetical protein